MMNKPSVEINLSLHPSRDMLDYLFEQSLAPNHAPTITRAVNVINGFPMGKLIAFQEDVEYADIDTCMYWEQYARLAEIALKAGITRLRRFSLDVAITLCEQFPKMEDGCAGRIEYKDRFRKVGKGRVAPGYVYLVQSSTGAHKIGRTVDPNNRMRTFSVKLPFEVEYVCLIQTDDMYGLEASLHARFHHKRINGEWFALTSDDVEYIKGLAK